MTPVERETLEFLKRDVPDLADAYVAELPRARRTTLANLAAAMLREDAAGLASRSRRVGHQGLIDLDGDRTLVIHVEREFAFGRMRVGSVLLCSGGCREVTDPVELLALLGVEGEFAREVAESVANLAMSYACVARRTPEADHLMFERLCAEGHNIHPCGRVRRGMSPAESHRYAAECAGTVGLRLVAVPRSHVRLTPDERGRDVGEILAHHFALPDPPPGHVLLPVHPWQLEHALPASYAAELAAGVIKPLPDLTIPADATASLRSVVTGPGRRGRRLVVKTALDVLLTSTRRSMSPATTGNGPPMSRLLNDLLDAEPALKGRATAVRELAGASFRHGDQRNLSVLLREDPAGHIEEGEVGISGCALCATSPVTGRSLLADHSRMEPLAFLREYARLLLPVVLTLLVKHGIGLEAHLQNTIVIFRDGRPVRLLLRDFAGLRFQPDRLDLPFDPYPGSITATTDIAKVRQKVFYAAVQANLAEIVIRLVTEDNIPEAACWSLVREEAERVFAELGDLARTDRAALYAGTLSQKAFVRMRLDPGAGDIYRPVPNPLGAVSP